MTLGPDDLSVCGFSFATRSVLLLRLSRMRSLAGFLFYSTFGFTFPPASTSGVAQSHVSLIRCRGALAKLIPPRFGFVRVDVACLCLHPGDSQERGRVSKVMPCCRCKQSQSSFPPHSPLPMCLCSQKGCWEINLDFQLPLHLPLLRVGWFPWEPAPGYTE